MSGPATIDLNSTVVRSADLVHSLIDDEVVMMSVETGRYYSLADVGARIWDLLGEPTQVDELCERLVREYRVDRARCRDEVLSFVCELADQGLAVISQEPNLGVDHG